MENLDEKSKAEEAVKLIKSLNNISYINLISREIEKKIELTDYIILPETRNHPDLLIAKNKSHENKKWFQAQGLLKQEDSFMLTPELFAEFLRLLKSKRELFDGFGNLITEQNIKERILEEILEIRNPWRAEGLDQKYLRGHSKLFVSYHKFDSSGKLIQVTEQLNKETLMHSRTPGISLDDYVENPTSQGLPKKIIKEGGLWYWPPIENNVAGFFVCADWAYFNCSTDPNVSDANLGVRKAKIYQKQ